MKYVEFEKDYDLKHLSVVLKEIQAKALKELGGWNAYVIAYERFTSVDRDVKRVISTRQVSPPSHAVSVPQFEAEERRPVLLDTYFIEEHLRRRDHPRQVADTHVADPANPHAITFLTRIEWPVLGSYKRPLRVGVTCKREWDQQAPSKNFGNVG